MPLESSTVAGIVGAILLAITGWVGKSAALYLQAKVERSKELEHAKKELERANEERPWQAMSIVSQDLVESLKRLSEANQKLHVHNDKLRDERDKARIDATEWEIKARRLNGIAARVTELEAKVIEDRQEYDRRVEQLRAQLKDRRHRT